MRIISWFILSLFFFSCKVQKEYVPGIFTSEKYCEVSPSIVDIYDAAWLNKIKHDTFVSPLTKKRFTQRARSVAADMGILSLLNQFCGVENKNLKIKQDTVEALFIRESIFERVSLAFLEVSSVLNEIECEQDRAIELKNFLQAKTDQKVRKLTFLSIMAGAVSTALGSTLTLSEADQPLIEAAVSGGAALSAYWAIRTFAVKASISFNHRKNQLRDIWTNPEISDIFPPMVWQFIRRELDESEETPVVREIIIERWQELGLLGEKGSKVWEKRTGLFFGSGGLYSLEEAELRISLLDLLETEINIMKQELKQLEQELLINSLD